MTKRPKKLLPPNSLTIRKGRFVLEEVESENLRKKLGNDPYWKQAGNDSFLTTSLGAARVYRPYADARVEKLFQKTFQTHYPLPYIPPLSGLDPHQRRGIEWILSRKRSYLAHAPGAGKTAQAIIAAMLSDVPECQTLFIVPPSLVKNWEREIIKFSEWVDPDDFASIGRIGKTEDKDNVAWRADFVIVPDSMIAKDWVYEKLLERDWNFIAVDEASRFKESSSIRTIALFGGRVDKKKFSGLFRKARHVVLLDGSPMPNRPMELWAPTYALHPECIDCMDQNDFGYRYCGARPNEHGVWEFLHSSHETELKDKIQSDFMQVVPEEGLGHPARRRSIVFMEDVRSVAHKEWERRHLSELAGWGRLNEKAVLTEGDLARFRRELGLRKVPWIARYVRERLTEKNEYILLFAWHREVCFKLTEQLVKFNPITVVGGLGNETVDRSFKAFQEGKTRLLIANIAVAGRGHNLQRADRVIFGEFSWTDETNRQCEKRASRKGSEKEFVRCEYVVVPGSVDEMVLSSVFTKEKRVKKVIG